MRWKRGLRGLLVNSFDKNVIKNTDRPLILICGPTGVGKSELAISLAKEIDGEIISADSVQVYRGLNIGSAKITKEEMQDVKHYLIDCLDPDKDFGVHIFKQMAEDAIKTIYANGHVPIVVGGTAFYIQALLYDIDFSEEGESDHSFRDELIASVTDEQSAILLWSKLKEIDSKYADSVHYNNVKRVARALEYNHHTGRLFSDYNEEQSKRESVYNHLYFALNDDRDILYDRINRRVDKMIENGLVDEVKGLLDIYDRNLSSLSSIGYKEIGAFLSRELEYNQAIELIKQNSRRYAKRQLTWLRKEADVIFIDRNSYKGNEDILGFMLNEINNKWQNVQKI